MQPGVKVNGAFYCDDLLLKQLLPDICQAAGNFCFPVHDVCARALSCCNTRLDFTPDMWPPSRPDLSLVAHRILTVIQECIYQKQEGTSNIVDELQLLTEWHFINRMTHYISQGRVETATRRGGWFCRSFVANLFKYLCALLSKIIKIKCCLTKLFKKIKGYSFFALQCIRIDEQWLAVG